MVKKWCSRSNIPWESSLTLTPVAELIVLEPQDPVRAHVCYVAEGARCGGGGGGDSKAQRAPCRRPVVDGFSSPGAPRTCVPGLGEPLAAVAALGRARERRHDVRNDDVSKLCAVCVPQHNAQAPPSVGARPERLGCGCATMASRGRRQRSAMAAQTPVSKKGSPAHTGEQGQAWPETASAVSGAPGRPKRQRSGAQGERVDPVSFACLLHVPFVLPPNRLGFPACTGFLWLGLAC